MPGTDGVDSADVLIVGSGPVRARRIVIAAGAQTRQTQFGTFLIGGGRPAIERIGPRSGASIHTGRLTDHLERVLLTFPVLGRMLQARAATLSMRPPIVPIPSGPLTGRPADIDEETRARA